MKKTIGCLLLFFCFHPVLFPKSNPWGELKKIYLYDSLKKMDKVVESIDSIDMKNLKRSDRKEIALKFINLGDYYFKIKNFEMAKILYRKVIQVSPGYWYLINKLEMINREKGRFLFGFKNAFRQFSLIFHDFETAYLLFNNFFKMLFFASMLIFFIMAGVFFIRYFTLAGNDILLDQENKFSLKQVILLMAVLLWPVLIFSGWMIYPFLLVGFLWIYLSDQEKKSVVFILILISIVSVLYSFSQVIEDQYRKSDFKVIKRVYKGDLFEKKVYDKFDNKMKVLQALSFYNDDQPKIAEEIVRSTGDDYRDKIKYSLLGNIYYRFDNIPESIKYYRLSLGLDDSSKIALNNFTMALLKNNNPEVFQSWAKRYPEIDEYKNKLLSLKEIELTQSILWRRLFNLTKQKFDLFLFLKNMLKKFFTFPVIYFIFILIGYVFFIPKLFSLIGISTYCSKCSKIIKESTVHRSYKLCNDCYQLFLIKDIIFLDAKILKEKELAKKSKKKYIIVLLSSILIPGLKLNFSGQNRLFVIFSGLFYFLIGYYILNVEVLKKMFSAYPFFLNFVGILAMFLYFLLNIYILRGSEDGI